MAPRTLPVLVYDGDCGFCTTCARFAERRLTCDVEIVAYQAADLDDLGLTAEQCAEAVQWVRPDGTVSSAHLAVGDLLRASGLPWSVAGRLAQTPPFSWFAAVVYRWIAANRHRLPGGGSACSIESPSPGHRPD
ncbi:DUF393 domain-containing protein [Gordonia caeni]|uniref:DUF393 domain-containing protein n=1 Tax=Gordonia caeni TaxID=1007097 RepID=A0ABP7NMJ8_9ACTN